MTTPVPPPEEIRATLHQLARDELRIEGPLPDGDLSGHLDSVQRLTLVVAIEDHFEIIVEPEDEDGLRTIDDLVALIGARLAAPDPGTPPTDEAACA